MKISKYENAQTLDNQEKINKIQREAEKLTQEEIEIWQIKNGITDMMLGQIVGLSPAAISHWKGGKNPLKLGAKIAIYFFMQKIQ